MRSGLVLIELLIVLALTAIIAGIGVPRLVAAADAAATRNEAMRVITAIDVARGTAARLNAVAALRLAAAAYTASVTIGPDTVVAWNAPGPSGGVTLSGTGQPILFGPAGLAMGVSNRTIVISRGSAVRRVVISKLGRISY